MSKKLDGKVAIVTGGTRGIGAAIVLRLAEDGTNVAFSYVTSAERAQELVKEVETKGVRGLAVKANAGESRQVVDLVRLVHQHFGKLDILVNSAGLSLMGAVDDPNPDLATFGRRFAVNVTGLFQIDSGSSLAGSKRQILSPSGLKQSAIIPYVEI